MNQTAQGIIFKPYNLSKKKISFSLTLNLEKLNGPLRFIKNLYRKSALNDFTNIFGAPVA